MAQHAKDVWRFFPKPLLANDWFVRNRVERLIEFDRGEHLSEGLLYTLPAELYLEWAREDPPRRGPVVMNWLPIAIRSEGGDLSWHPALENFIAEFGDQGGVLAALSARLHPRSWSGSLAIHLRPQLKLLESWFTHARREVRQWARDQIDRTNTQIEEERRRSDDDHVR
jgi:hypothetical protein